MKEREIRLNDFLLELLVHWRVLILMVLVGGILFCGMSFIRFSLATADQGEDQIASLTELEKTLRPEQKTVVKSVLVNEEYYQLRLNYINNAALMRINPDQAPRIELILGITGAEDSSVNLSNIYEELLSTSELDSYVSERVEGISVQDMNELAIVARYGSTSVMEKTRTIHVVINSPDKETGESITDAVISYVNDKVPIVQKSFGPHEVIVLNRSYVELDNNDIRVAQRTARSEIISLEESLENSRNGWTDDVVQYYELLSGKEFEQGSGEDVAEEAQTKIPLSYRIKYIMIGIVFATFLYVFWVFMTFVLNKKLRYMDDFSGLFEVSLLGHIPDKKAKAKAFGFVDKWIESLICKNRKSFTTEEAVHLAMVAVAMTAKKNGLNSVSYIGCNLSDDAVALYKDLEQGLKERDIQPEFLNNILYDAEAMEKLNRVTAAVLVEKAGVTLYSEVDQELQLLKRQGIPVLGLIVLK